MDSGDIVGLRVRIKGEGMWALHLLNPPTPLALKDPCLSRAAEASGLREKECVYVCVCLSVCLSLGKGRLPRTRASLVFLDSRKERSLLVYFHKLSEEQTNGSLGKVLGLVFVLFFH